MQSATQEQQRSISPNYYNHNASGWCGVAVGQMGNDFYNLVYRQECQRWRGGDLPLSVAMVELTYCYEFPNATVQYRVVLCCEGLFSTISYLDYHRRNNFRAESEKYYA
jgi:hypothetical protein